MKAFKAGRYLQQQAYKAFIPEPIHQNWELDNMEVIQLLSRADRQLGRLDMYSAYVNIDLYVSTHVAKEATTSSRIEGTRTNMKEAFMEREDVSPERRDDWEEVQNYITAMQQAITGLQKLPFSNRLIRQTHAALMQGVRGQHKQPGTFRTSQNWIGGASISDARFIPPPASYVPELMSDLEEFANDNYNPLPELLKIALIHYQFETIHPFLDGNGRVGRLLITLYLVNQGILKRPILYLSDFFERNRSLYYDNLTRVRTHNDITQWYKFFLTGVIQTAEQGIITFDGILQLQKQLEETLQPLAGRAQDAQKLLQVLYKKPVTDAQQVAQIIDKSKVSAYKLIADLESKAILQEVTGAKRGKMYIFKPYLDLF